MTKPKLKGREEKLLQEGKQQAIRDLLGFIRMRLHDLDCEDGLMLDESARYDEYRRIARKLRRGDL